MSQPLPPREPGMFGLANYLEAERDQAQQQLTRLRTDLAAFVDDLEAERQRDPTQSRHTSIIFRLRAILDPDDAPEDTP